MTAGTGAVALVVGRASSPSRLPGGPPNRRARSPAPSRPSSRHVRSRLPSRARSRSRPAEPPKKAPPAVEDESRASAEGNEEEEGR